MIYKPRSCKHLERLQERISLPFFKKIKKNVENQIIIMPIKCNRCGRIFKEGEQYYPHKCVCPNITNARAYSDSMFSDV